MSVLSQAADACALMASSSRPPNGLFIVDFEDPVPSEHQEDFGEVCNVLSIGIHSRAADIAREAFWRTEKLINCYGGATGRQRSDLIRQRWAEAEAALRILETEERQS